MFGYCGFGLQKWIYRQRPKTFMKWERKPIHTEIEAYKPNQFKPKFPGPISSYELIKILKTRSQDDKILNLINSIMCASFIIIIISTLPAIFCLNLKNYEESQRMKREFIRKEKVEAYQFLIKSGRLELEKGDLNSAHYDLMLARNVFPNQVYHYVELANLYTTLCKTENLYCYETSIFKKEIIQTFPNEKYLIHMEK